MNIAYIISKAMSKLGMSFNDVMDTSYHRITSLLNGYKAVNAEDNLTTFNLLSNYLYLNSEKTKDKFKNLPESIKEIYEKNGIKTMELDVDFAKYEARRDHINRESDYSKGRKVLAGHKSGNHNGVKINI